MTIEIKPGDVDPTDPIDPVDPDPKDPADPDPKDPADPVEPKGETLQARKARLERQLKQTNKKLGVDEPKPKPSKSDDFDYGEKAYLKASGIQGSDEMEMVKEIMGDTGKSLEAVLESKHFQGVLKEFRDTKISDAAVPKGTKRAPSNSVNDVDFWLAKGDELPPNIPENRKLRQDVVNARIKLEKGKSQFSPSSRVIVK